jgi:hypothetical protein
VLVLEKIRYYCEILSRPYSYLFAYFKKYVHLCIEHVILYCRLFYVVLCTPFVKGRAFGSIVAQGTMLQARRLQVRFLIRFLDFSVDLILPRNLPEGKQCLALKANNLTTVCEPIVRKCGSLDIS